jgi:hypothetical protein
MEETVSSQSVPRCYKEDQLTAEVNKRLKLGGSHVYERSSVFRLPWQCELLLVGHKLLY